MMNNLILASSNNKDRLAAWKQDLSEFEITTILNSKLDTLRAEVLRIKPEILVLDFGMPELNCIYGISELRRLCTETKIIVSSDSISERLEWELLQAGVRGCCRNDITPEVLNNIVKSVQQGELWIRRTLTCRLIDELGKTTSKNKTYRASLGLLNKLTQREFDIALCVGNGQSNKQIAQTCAITERTVKAHLTEVYLKLGVSDRLNLALALKSEDKNVRTNSDIR